MCTRRRVVRKSMTWNGIRTVFFFFFLASFEAEQELLPTYSLREDNSCETWGFQCNQHFFEGVKCLKLLIGVGSWWLREAQQKNSYGIIAVKGWVELWTGWPSLQLHFVVICGAVRRRRKCGCFGVIKLSILPDWIKGDRSSEFGGSCCFAGGVHTWMCSNKNRRKP